LASDALDQIAALRREDGSWWPGRCSWRAPGCAGSNVEVVDWGRRGPNQMVTLNPLRVLRSAGRLEL